jgi:hypothetical protein
MARRETLPHWRQGTAPKPQLRYSPLWEHQISRLRNSADYFCKVFTAQTLDFCPLNLLGTDLLDNFYFHKIVLITVNNSLNKNRSVNFTLRYADNNNLNRSWVLLECVSVHATYLYFKNLHLNLFFRRGLTVAVLGLWMQGIQTYQGRVCFHARYSKRFVKWWRYVSKATDQRTISLVTKPKGSMLLPDQPL